MNLHEIAFMCFLIYKQGISLLKQGELAAKNGGCEAGFLAQSDQDGRILIYEWLTNDW